MRVLLLNLSWLSPLTQVSLTPQFSGNLFESFLRTKKITVTISDVPAKAFFDPKLPASSIQGLPTFKQICSSVQ